MTDNNEIRHAMIFTGGDWDPAKLSLSALPQPDYIIAADSGYDKAAALGICPDLLVGEFDSLRHDKSTLPASMEIYKVPCEKDVTDTMLACDVAIARGYRRITIAGGTGGRADHGLSNILYLENLTNRNVDALLTDGENRIMVCRDRTIEIPDRGGYFSVFALDTCVVTLTGCKYPLHTATLRRDLPYAVSNEVLPGGTAVVEISGVAVVMESVR